MVRVWGAGTTPMGSEVQFSRSSVVFMLWGSITGFGLVRTSRLALSLSGHFGRLPARTLPAGLPAGDVSEPGVQGRRALGAPARDRCLAPSGRPGPLQAGRPAMARGAVAAGSPPPVGRGVPSDARDAARLAPPAGRAQVGLHEPPAPRAAVLGHERAVRPLAGPALQPGNSVGGGAASGSAEQIITDPSRCSLRTALPGAKLSGSLMPVRRYRFDRQRSERPAWARATVGTRMRCPSHPRR